MLASTTFLVLIAAAALQAPDASTADAGAGQRQFTVNNACSGPIWLQQENMTGPGLQKLDPGASVRFAIPDGGQASTRLWAKLGCDPNGNNCTVGQSSPPCPPAGCTPPVDSKIEVTWGCVLPKAQCNKTPQGDSIQNTWWNSSAVDGYTLPYTITTSDPANCKNVDCSYLDMKECPAAEDLSQGLTKKHPEYASVNLNVKGEAACFSPCTALGYPTYGGKGVQPPSADAAAPYCCPTPPVGPEKCSAGPVAKTKYVAAIHSMCVRTAYAYAYDDGIGLRQCDPKTTLTMTFCPPRVN